MTTNHFKYPRTPHLPWSASITNDDRIILADDLHSLFCKRLLITIKMDGENTTMYRDYIHARSLDSKDHESRHWVKYLHASIKHLIPNGWRICGENMFAKHSIYYDNLPSYFLVFSVWNNENECLSYADTMILLSDLGLTYVPVMFDGFINIENASEYLYNVFKHYETEHEGYVIRSYNGFHYNDFSKNIAKYVRPNHVQTNKHWMAQKIIKNGVIV